MNAEIKKQLKRYPKIAEAILIMVLASLFIAYPLQYLWNITMPDIFGVKSINFWQSFRLFLIIRLLWPYNKKVIIEKED